MSTRTCLVCFLGLVLAGGAPFLFTGFERAFAGFTDEDQEALVELIESDMAFNLKLCALDALRLKSSETVEADLAQIAAGSDKRLAIFAMTQLGKKGSAAAKACLKDALEDSGLDTELRMSAMTAIAVHFKDAGDLDYLESQSKDDADLAGHFLWLKTNVFKAK